MTATTDLSSKILAKMASRRRIGMFDWSPGSWDCRVAVARAYRIRMRLRGERITLRQALSR